MKVLRFNEAKLSSNIHEKFKEVIEEETIKNIFLNYFDDVVVTDYTLIPIINGVEQDEISLSTSNQMIRSTIKTETITIPFKYLLDPLGIRFEIPIFINVNGDIEDDDFDELIERLETVCDDIQTKVFLRDTLSDIHSSLWVSVKVDLNDIKFLFE